MSFAEKRFNRFLREMAMPRADVHHERIGRRLRCARQRLAQVVHKPACRTRCSTTARWWLCLPLTIITWTNSTIFYHISQQLSCNIFQYLPYYSKCSWKSDKNALKNTSSTSRICIFGRDCQPSRCVCFHGSPRSDRIGNCWEVFAALMAARGLWSPKPMNLPFLGATRCNSPKKKPLARPAPH